MHRYRRAQRHPPRGPVAGEHAGTIADPIAGVPVEQGVRETQGIADPDTPVAHGPKTRLKPALMVGVVQVHPVAIGELDLKAFGIAYDSLGALIGPRHR